MHQKFLQRINGQPH